MIVIISGKAINPDHVATVIPYGNERDIVVTMSHGKYLHLPVLEAETEEQALVRIVERLNQTSLYNALDGIAGAVGR